MAQIDFQSYIAFLAAELPRFSIPGVGTFVWHVEKVAVDPKSAIVTPPRSALKYEPGHRYQSETVAFLHEHFGISYEEADALLREIGKAASAYLRAAGEMDLWKFGKIKKVGASYRVELNEEAQIPVAVELYEVSLRSGVTAAVASPPPIVSSSSPPAKKSKSTPAESPRARVVETSEEILSVPEIEASPPSSERRWGLIIVGIGLVLVLLAGGVFWILSKRKPAQPVEIVLSQPRTPSAKEKPAAPKETPSASSPSPTQPSTPSKSEPVKKETPVSPTPAPKPEPPKAVLQPTPAPTPSKGPRYHIIVGSYPSRSEAEEKARTFTGYRIEYLPGKDPGWVRLSIYSSENKADVVRKLQEIRGQVPDAWIFTQP